MKIKLSYQGLLRIDFLNALIGQKAFYIVNGKVNISH